MTKTCNTCLQTKPLSNFGNSRNPKKTATNFRAQHALLKAKCKTCDAEYAREWRKKHKNYKGSGAITKYPKEDRLLVSAIGSRLIDAKSRIKKYNQIPTDLDKDYLYQLFKQQKGKCALSGVVLALELKSLITLSLDKINPDDGYVKGNVQWLAWAVNRAKGELKQSDFFDMCKRVTEKCNDYPEKEYSQVAGSAQPQETG